MATRVEHGVGVAADMHKATRYYQEAKDLGSARAKIRLAQLTLELAADDASASHDVAAAAQQVFFKSRFKVNSCLALLKSLKSTTLCLFC